MAGLSPYAKKKKRLAQKKASAGGRKPGRWGRIPKRKKGLRR